MARQSYTEKDWKLFRKYIAGWQDAYMERLNRKYIDLLSGDGKPSEKFWELEGMIREDKKDTGVVCDMRRSQLLFNLADLLREEAITMDDLEEFSDELKDELQLFCG